MKTNTIILEGGLGNRMRVAAAAYTMAQRSGIPMRVLWTKQWGMNCRFGDLFEADPVDPPPALPIREGAVTNDSCKADACSEHSTPSLTGRAGGGSAKASFSLRDARGFERFLFSRPTLQNLWLPRLLQRLRYRHIILSPQIYYLQRDGFDFETWFRQGGTLMTAYRDFCPWDDRLIPLLFHPLPAIEQEVNNRAAAFTAYTIGLHIRRTDNQASIDANDAWFYLGMGRDTEDMARVLEVTSGHKWPTGVTFTTEESDELDLYTANLGTYVTEQCTAFLLGNKDVNDDAEWDAYIKGLDQYHLDRVLALRQACYDRYLSR